MSLSFVNNLGSLLFGVKAYKSQMKIELTAIGLKLNSFSDSLNA
jgi:hypothetical protein